MGADEDTVRNRVRKLHDSGLIKAWHVIANPRLHGGGELVVWFDARSPSHTDYLMKSLQLLEGITILNRFHGGFLAIVLRYDDESILPRKLEFIRRIANVDRLGLGRIPFPDCTAELTGPDWKIVRALHTNPRRSYATISREVGLSSRTVKRRLQRMIRERAIFAFPTIKPEGLNGAFMTYLFVAYPMDRKQEVEKAISKELDAYLWHILHLMPFEPGETGRCGFNLILPSIAKARDILDWVRSLPDVIEARTEFFEDIITSYDSSDELPGRRSGSIAAPAE